MAALTGITTSTLDDLLVGAAPDVHVYTAGRAPWPFDSFLYMNRLDGALRARTFATLGALAPDAGVKTELDVFTDQALSSSGVTLTITGPVGLTSPVSDLGRDKSQALAQAMMDAPPAMYDRIHTDGATLCSSLTNSTNLGGDFTLANWGAALAAFKAQLPSAPMFVFVGKTQQLSQLDAEMRATAAQYGAVSIDWLANAGQLAGIRGIFEGVLVVESGNIPQYDASKWQGMFLAGMELMQEPSPDGHSGLIGGPLGMVYDLDEQGNFIRLEQQRISERTATRLTASARYSVGVVNQGRGRQIISTK